MRKPLVAGNWKMHGSRSQLGELLSALLSGLPERGGADVLVCPAFVYLQEAATVLGKTQVYLGAQDACDQAGEGAFTGEVASGMLADVGCSHVIIGHSERRAMYGDTDDRVADKFAAVQSAGLTPLLCVGETLEQREDGSTESVVARQLEAVIAKVGVAALNDSVLAYEPVWAIGTGKTATPEQAQQVHAFIRAMVSDKDAKIGSSLRILYGGSVKPGNAAEIFGMPDVDGGLIGGASLKGEDFLQIIAAAGN